LVFGVRYRNAIPPFFRRAVGTSVLPVIVLNLVIGFTIPGIDNSAHISGLLMGAVLAGIVPFQKPGAETPRVFEAIQVALLVLIGVCLFQVATHYDGPRLALANLPRGLTQFLPVETTSSDFVQAINNAQTTFESSAHDIETSQLNRLAADKRVLAKSIDELRRIPPVAPTADRLAGELLLIIQEQYNLVQDVERSGTVTVMSSQRLKTYIAQYDQVTNDLSKWADTEGPQHGIAIRKGR